MEVIKDTQNSIKVGEVNFPGRKVWIKTFGCQMNYHDTDRIYSHLENLNFTPTTTKDDADLIIFNSCAIRDLSNQKFYSQLGEVKHLKEKKDVKVAVCGCVAQTEGKALVKKYKQLDFAFGTDVIDSVNDFVYRTYAGESKFSVNTWDRSSDFSIETKRPIGSPCAFINIIKGCDKFCSYCIVPFTRGREKSRTINEIVKDVSNLVKYQNVQEITLLGQNVNSFGKQNNETLAQLIYRLEEIEGLYLIRYTTSHPYDVSDDLIKAHGDCRKLSRHLHLPVQSGSNTVLERMLREYTVEHYLDLVRKLRESCPDIVLSTDIIAGFPNETQSEHEKTLELLETVKYDFIYAYTFSERKGTKAAKIEDKLTKNERGARLREIQNLQKSIQESQRQELVGKTLRVLVEGKSVLHEKETWKGRSNCFRIVHFNHTTKEDLKWHWVDLKITESHAYSCKGEVVKFWGKTPPPNDYIFN